MMIHGLRGGDRISKNINVFFLNFFYTIYKFYYSIIQVYMYVKIPLGDLNPNPYPLHPTNIYTCRVAIVSRLCDGSKNIIVKMP